jgi:hypothetical protein
VPGVGRKHNNTGNSESKMEKGKEETYYKWRNEGVKRKLNIMNNKGAEPRSMRFYYYYYYCLLHCSFPLYLTTHCFGLQLFPS